MVTLSEFHTGIFTKTIYMNNTNDNTATPVCYKPTFDIASFVGGLGIGVIALWIFAFASRNRYKSSLD